MVVDNVLLGDFVGWALTTDSWEELYSGDPKIRLAEDALRDAVAAIADKDTAFAVSEAAAAAEAAAAGLAMLYGMKLAFWIREAAEHPRA